MNRRHVAVLGTAALAAIASGAGLAVWRSKRAGSIDAARPIDVWSLALQKLDGGSLALATLRGQPLLLNFWATWCAPCVIEMPLLDRFARDKAGSGWRVLALAIDQADPVRRFLAERTLHLPVALGGVDGIDLSRSLGNDRGALPFTAIFDSAGKLVAQKLGSVSTDLLSEWTLKVH